MMKRRQFLPIVGGVLAGVAGCLSDPSGQSTTTAPPQSSTTSTETPPPTTASPQTTTETVQTTEQGLSLRNEQALDWYGEGYKKHSQGFSEYESAQKMFNAKEWSKASDGFAFANENFREAQQEFSRAVSQTTLKVLKNHAERAVQKTGYLRQSALNFQSGAENYLSGSDGFAQMVAEYADRRRRAAKTIPTLISPQELEQETTEDSSPVEAPNGLSNLSASDRRAFSQYSNGYESFNLGISKFDDAMPTYENEEWKPAADKFAFADDYFGDALPSFRGAFSTAEMRKLKEYIRQAEKKTSLLSDATLNFSEAAEEFADNSGGGRGEYLDEHSMEALKAAQDIEDPLPPEELLKALS